MHPKPEQCWSVDSFIGERCSGNAHRVQIFGGQWPETATHYDNAITVDLQLNAERNQEVAARFSVGGHWIQRCGSGNVAAAYVLVQELGLSEIYLKTACERLQLLHQHGRFGYITQPPALVPASCTNLLKAVTSTGKPMQKAHSPLSVECFTAGAEQDYWVAVLSNQEQVAQLQPNLLALAEYTQRSLIVTAQSSALDVDFVLRYFAPQYGVPEDAATGSANAVLANYWAQRLRKTELCSRQLSAKGGEFYLSLESGQPASDLLKPSPLGVYGRAMQR